jgi:hypothetical protein
MALHRAEGRYAAIHQAADQLADLQMVMRLIDVVVDEVVAETSLQQRALVPNALLNLAVERMLAEEPPGSAAAILYRLAELIADDARPCGSEAFPLNGHDA